MNNLRKMTADTVVVGTGPGGATVARDLAMKGKRVILLEWGPDVAPTGKAFSGGSRYLGGLGAWRMNRGLLLSKEFTLMVRGVTTGGSTMLYLGCAHDPDPDMWAPFGLTLRAEADEIKEELNVAPLPDNLIGQGARILMDAALEVGLDWRKINKFIDSSKCVPDCNECIFGCERSAKWHARDWAIDSTRLGATLINNAFCDEVIRSNGEAVGVRATGKNGVKYEIESDTVVISAGGVGSPIILQKSGIHDAGRSFFVDPFVFTCGRLRGDEVLGREAMMVAGAHLKEEGVYLTDMFYPYILHANYAVTAMKPGELTKYDRTLSIMTKIRDDLNGFVTIDSRISKPLGNDDHYKLNKGRAISRDILKKAGVRDEDIWHTTPGSAHPGGTCAMGKIVDENLQTEIGNCYVCDASVIPAPFGIPPTLTIMSLARRLSNHLASGN